MDTQAILVIVIFIAALVYLGRTIYRSATSKGGSCGSCNGSQCKVDFSKIDTKAKQR